MFYHVANLGSPSSDAKSLSERTGTPAILISPVYGTITQLATHSLGGVEVKVLNKDVGFRAGQSVAIKIEAFPFTRYGTAPGRIESISSDAVEDEKLGLVYTVRIALGRDALRRDGSMVPLGAGMAVTADIQTGRRTIGSYLMSPIDEAAPQVGRER